MKLRKLLLCALASLVIVGMSQVSALAAEAEAGTELENIAEDAIVEETAITEAEEETEETEEVIVEDTDSEDSDTDVKVQKQENEKKYTKAELRLLAALISCEAGSEPYAGKLAVGIVVVNRKESKLFPSTIKNVIYQKYQFGPARNGSLKKALSRYDSTGFDSGNDKDCVKAAKAALSGAKEITYKGKDIDFSKYLYFSGRVSGAKISIANHQFK